jgi:Rrf2 family protein
MLEFDGRLVLGLYVLHYMARKEGPASATEIAETGAIPRAFARTLLRRFRRAGWVASRRGRGYTLVKAPGQITINDIVRLLATRSPAPGGCRTRYFHCPYKGSCPVASLCREAYESNRRILRSFSIADLGPGPAQMPECAGWRKRAAR